MHFAIAFDDANTRSRFMSMSRDFRLNAIACIGDSSVIIENVGDTRYLFDALEDLAHFSEKPAARPLTRRERGRYDGRYAGRSYEDRDYDRRRGRGRDSEDADVFLNDDIAPLLQSLLSVTPLVTTVVAFPDDYRSCLAAGNGDNAIALINDAKDAAIKRIQKVRPRHASFSEAVVRYLD